MKRKRVGASVLAALFPQLAEALRAGIGLSDTLAILSKDADLTTRHMELIAHLRERVDAGEPLSAALGAYNSTFSPEAVAMVRAAERENVLPQALELMATDYELQMIHRMAIRGTLAWPATIVVVAFLVITVIMIFVVPAFAQVFENFGADLPGPTLVLIAVSNLFVRHWWWLLLLAAPLAWVMSRGRHSRGRAAIDRALIRVPFVRAYLMKTFLLRLSHILVTVAESHLPLQPALGYLGATAGNRRLAEITGALEAQVRDGKDIASAVRDTAHMPGQLAVALTLGALANNQALALRQIVTMSEGEAQRSLMRLERAGLITIYICLGLVLGYTIIALYMPIFKLGSVV